MFNQKEKAYQTLNAWYTLKNPYQDVIGLKILKDLKEILHHRSELNDDLYHAIYYVIHSHYPLD